MVQRPRSDERAREELAACGEKQRADVSLCHGHVGTARFPRASNRGAAAGGRRERSLGVDGRGQVLEEASRRETKAEGTGRSIPEASLQPNQSQAQARQQQQ